MQVMEQRSWVSKGVVSLLFCVRMLLFIDSVQGCELCGSLLYDLFKVHTWCKFAISYLEFNSYIVDYIVDIHNASA